MYLFYRAMPAARVCALAAVVSIACQHGDGTHCPEHAQATPSALAAPSADPSSMSWCPSNGPAVDDGNACTIDFCFPFFGVIHWPRTAGTSCADGDVCNGTEVCDGA